MSLTQSVEATLTSFDFGRPCLYLAERERLEGGRHFCYDGRNTTLLPGGTLKHRLKGSSLLRRGTGGHRLSSRHCLEGRLHPRSRHPTVGRANFKKRASPAPAKPPATLAVRIKNALFITHPIRNPLTPRRDIKWFRP